jgi:hypothetical protein
MCLVLRTYEARHWSHDAANGRNRYVKARTRAFTWSSESCHPLVAPRLRLVRDPRRLRQTHFDQRNHLPPPVPLSKRTRFAQYHNLDRTRNHKSHRNPTTIITTPTYIIITYRVLPIPFRFRFRPRFSNSSRRRWPWLRMGS